MNPAKNLSLLLVLGLVAALCSCSFSSGSNLSGTYAGKNTLGFTYQIQFISATDCIITDPRRGQGPATYRIVGDHVLITMPGGGAADVAKQGDTLTFNDGGYVVSLTKQ